MNDKKIYAGIAPFCLSTKNILIVKRSGEISNPFKWCAFGGGAESGESIEFTARREFKEESGLTLQYDIIKATYDHKMLGATYYNYWGLFEEEFVPLINKKTVDEVTEIIDYKWLTIDKALDYDLIFGFKKFLEISYKDLKRFYE